MYITDALQKIFKNEKRVKMTNFLNKIQKLSIKLFM